MSKKSESKRKKRLEKQRQLLALFDKPTGYDEKHINDSWYIKMWNGTTQRWQVAKFSEDSFSRYKAYSRKRFTPKKKLHEGSPIRCGSCMEILGYGNDRVSISKHSREKHWPTPKGIT